MGYFALPAERTRKATVEAIRTNADLWLSATVRNDSNYDYLVLSFIAGMVDQYRGIVADEKDTD